MNQNEFDRAARAWLEDGPTRMSDQALLATLEVIHETRQRRAAWRPWRTSPVSMFASVGIATVLVAALGILAVNVVPSLQRAPSVGASPAPIPTVTASPSPSPSPTPSGAPEETPDVRLTTPFRSPTNGFSVMIIARSSVTPATAAWTPPQPLKNAYGAPGPFYDIFETGLLAAFNGTSTVIPDGVPLDEWIDQSIASVASTGTCMLPRAEQAEISIDGQPARVSEGCAGQFVATVVAGGRLYVFELVHGWDNEADARAFFDSWLAAVRLTPETAAPVSSAPPSR
jgi:hypothetical protein